MSVEIPPCSLELCRLPSSLGAFVHVRVDGKDCRLPICNTHWAVLVHARAATEECCPQVAKTGVCYCQEDDRE